MTPSNSEPTSQAQHDRAVPNPVAGRIDPVPEPVRPARQLPPEPPPPGLSAPPDLGSLLRSLGRRWMLAAVLSIILGGLAGVGVWILLTPDFTAFSQIKVDFAPASLTDKAPRATTHFGAYIKSQAALFKSRPIIQSALRKEEVRKLNLEADTPDPISAIEDRLVVSVTDTSELMTAQLTHRDPTVALTLMRALTDSYMEYVDFEKTVRGQRDTELEKAIGDLQGEVKKKQNILRDKAKQFATIDPESIKRKREEIQGTIRDLRSQRLPLKTDLGRAEAALKAFQYRPLPQIPVKVDETQVQLALRSDQIAGPMYARVDAARATMKYFERAAVNPEQEIPWQRAKRELALAEAEISRRRDEVRREMDEKLGVRVKEELARLKGEQDLQKLQLTDHIKEVTEQLARLDKDMADQQAEADRLPTIQTVAETDGLEREITDHHTLLSSLTSQLEQNKLNARVGDRIHIHQEAAIMRKEARKQMMASLAAPVVIAGAICLLLAYGDYRQRRVYSANEVATGLGIRVVGAMPAVANLERRLVSPTGEGELEGHPVVESIDALRTTLLRESQRERRRVVLVTSAGAGEGKTTLAASLAISLARAGRRTLLIDGDLRRPAVNQLFEVPLQPGFSEVVLAEVDAVDAIQTTPIENLFVMPAGQWDREVLQCLARDGLESVLEKLRDEYDFILIDSHPVLSATDSLLLAQRCDGVLLAVLRGVSQMPRVYAASQRLTSLGVRVLGAVMIATDPEEVLPHANHHPVPVR